MPELNGAWEPKGYLGPRVEIEGNKLIRLWKNHPVLETEFESKELSDRTGLMLKNRELCYSGSDKPYAVIKECYYQNGALVLVDDFPITGESRDELYKTGNSRYGNVTFEDEIVLPQIAGEWQCEGSGLCMAFNGNRMKFGYAGSLNDEAEIIAVHYRYDAEGIYYIVDQNPAREGVGMFGRICYRGGEIRTYIPICDASPAELVFRKQ